MQLVEALADSRSKCFNTGKSLRGKIKAPTHTDSTAERERIASLLAGSSNGQDFSAPITSLHDFYTYGIYYDTCPICIEAELGTLFRSVVVMQFIAMSLVRTLSYDGLSGVFHHNLETFDDAWVAHLQAHLGSVNDTRLPIPTGHGKCTCSR